MPKLFIRKLYQDNQHKLNLTWVAGTSGADNLITHDEVQSNRAWVGHLNFIHPNRVQVLGQAEVDYLIDLPSAEQTTALDKLLQLNVAVMIVANGLPIPPVLRDLCHVHNVPLMSTPLESPFLMDMLRLYLARTLAISTVVHGVFLDVLEIGLLITGESAMGKSELALELISRGHGLIADDAVDIYRIGPDTLEARCPSLLRDFLEVRGLGILNIRRIFGETAIRPRKTVRLIIHLVRADDHAMKSLDRLSVQAETQTILGVAVRKVTLPVAAGRNLAVLVEAAVRSYVMQLRGIDGTREFLERHTHHMQNQNDTTDFN